MGWTPVTKAATTSGSAEGETSLNAFDNALLAAGIGNINLVKVSSILPPEAEVVDLPRLRPGAIVPTAFAAMTSEVPGAVAAAMLSDPSLNSGRKLRPKERSAMTAATAPAAPAMAMGTGTRSVATTTGR